jgi:hypothetical protein
MNAWEVLSALRDLYSKHPKYRSLHAWELVGLLWSLGYTEDLEDEGELAAAAEGAREDWPEWFVVLAACCATGFYVIGETL